LVGLFGPAGLPTDVAQKLTNTVSEVLADPQVQKRLLASGSEAGAFESAAAFDAFARKNGAFTLERVKRAKSAD